MLEELARDAGGDLGAETARDLILVRHDDPVGLLHERRNRLPVERHQRPQIENGRLNALFLGLLRGEQGALHQCAPGHDRHVGALPA